MEPRALGPWSGLLVKAAFAIAALVVFAWVGRSLAVRVVKAVGAPDAGALPVVAQLPVTTAETQLILADGGGTPVAPVAPVAPAPSHASADVRATPEDPVFLNQASPEQLRRLPGAGPKRAEAIVDLRRRIGKFQRVEDLMRVKGIGRSTIRRWRPLVRLDAPPHDAPPRDAPPRDAPPRDAPPRDAPPRDAPPRDAGAVPGAGAR